MHSTTWYKNARKRKQNGRIFFQLNQMHDWSIDSSIHPSIRLSAMNCECSWAGYVGKLMCHITAYNNMEMLITHFYANVFNEPFSHRIVCVSLYYDFCFSSILRTVENGRKKEKDILFWKKKQTEAMYSALCSNEYVLNVEKRRKNRIKNRTIFRLCIGTHCITLNTYDRTIECFGDDDSSEQE